MKSLQILRHSFRQILRQPMAVLQIFLVPNALSFALIKLTGLAFIFSPFHVQVTLNRGQMPWGLLAIVMVIGMLLSLWSALAWHRFILLAEYPRSPWPPVAYQAFARFFRTGLIVAIAGFALIVLAFFVLGFVLGFASGFTHRPPGWIAWTIGVMAAVPILIAVLRIAVNLPNAAVQGDRTAGAVWEATKGSFWTLLSIFVCLTALRYGLGLLLQWQQFTPFSTVGYVVVALGEAAQAILAISVVTTIYGHYVEGRPLV